MKIILLFLLSAASVFCQSSSQQVLISQSISSGGSCGSFVHCRAITVDHTKVPSNQSNFPVLVSGTYSYLATVGNGGFATNSNGYDIGFYSDSGITTKLDWETELWTASNGLVVYWVRIPTVSSSVDTVFYMAYGNASITTDQSNKTGVWDTNFKGIWHLPNGTTLGATDSTSSANNGTITGATAGTGQIDGAGAFSGSGQYISGGVVSAASFPATLSCWFKSGASSTFGVMLSVDANANDGFRIGLGGSNKPEAAIGGVAVYDFTALSTLSTGTWYFLTVTFSGNGGSAIAYLAAAGGSLANQTLSIGTPSGAMNKFHLGVRGDLNSLTTWNGSLDELRYSNIARAADWITAEYNNQNSPSTFYTVGSQI